MPPTNNEDDELQRVLAESMGQQPGALMQTNPAQGIPDPDEEL